MKFFIKIIPFIFFVLLFSGKANATHVRAGELLFRQLAQYSFEITLITYTDSKGINRTEVDIEFGDGNMATVPRESVTYLGNEIKKNIYRTTYTYQGPGVYIISHFDRNRNAGITNMKYSVNTAFYIETRLEISPSKGGINRSPILLQPPIDFGCVGRVFVHNPNAYDPDGDSLTFSLITPRQDLNTPVVGYYQPPAYNFFQLDSRTGQLTWDSPKDQGIFNIAILVEEYRQGVKIGSLVRDMQIIVSYCTNSPPVIQPISDTCVEAGTVFSLNIPIKVSDLDTDQVITVSASGGPFLYPSTARLTPNPALGKKIVNAKFSWTVGCDYIRKEPYQVVIKATDSFSRPPLPLTDLEAFFITVVGPAPENLNATPTVKGINLSWNLSTRCNNAQAYFIYRKADSSHWDTTRCEIGVPAYTGFKWIARTTPGTNTTYLDSKGLVPGVRYCYRVTAVYKNNGNYEVVEGYASNEVCAILRMDVPVITHASVRETDNANGSVYVDWTKPRDVDTLLYKPPYKYIIYRADNQTGAGAVMIKTFTAPQFYQLSDTALIDTFLNTSNKSFSYKIEFYCTDSSADYLVGTSQVASTVFLGISSTHKSLVLSWKEEVPWYNDAYIIYKKNNITGLFDSIGWTIKNNYKDTDLVNGEVYCYKVESYGYYIGTNEFPNPIKNFSQYVCAIPRDTFPPCPPLLIDAESHCELAQNNVHWGYDVAQDCDSDVVAYKIFFRDRLTTDYYYINQVNGHDANQFTDTRTELAFSQAGCYKIRAIDKYNNESIFSNEICVNNCPAYILPNVFTPNGDGINDLYFPIQGSMHIEKVNMRIFNRWGQLVYQTINSKINWDGKDMETGKDCAMGTYFYVCDIDKMYLEGNQSVRITGTITLLR